MSDQNKFENGKIYKIICVDQPTLLYIGSTTQTVEQRWLQHKNDAKKKARVNTLVYQTLNDIGFENFSTEVIEVFPCKSRSELLEREDHWINTLQPTLNTNRARIPPDDAKVYTDHYQQVYRTEKHEIIKERQAIYRANNKATINRKAACPLCGRVVVQKLMKRHQRSKICKIEAYVEFDFVSSGDEEIEIEFID